MIAIITGDIIHSRRVNASDWMPHLKKLLKELATTEENWEIYRGDSFQLAVPVSLALESAFRIKSLIKCNNMIDVRLSIGIGTIDYKGKKITESNGSAFIHSGEAFEKLKNHTLIIKSPEKSFDEYFNPILRLVSFITDQWKPATSETIFYALSHKNLLQKEIAEKLSKDKTTINRALKRGAYDELAEILNLYSQKTSSW